MVKNTQSMVYQRLVEAIAKNRAIAMVGAGSSIRVGFPNWTDLLERLSSEAVQIDPKCEEELNSLAHTNDYLVYAGKIKTILGPKVFASHLKEIFGPDKPKHDIFHETLVQLPFCHFLTTNYDRVLQSTYECCYNKPYAELDLDEQAKRNSLIGKLQDRSIEKHFVHVHGSIKRPECIVLALDDYNERYIRTNDCTEALKIIFTLQPLVFMGFSLNDSDFTGPLRFLNACLGTGEPKHFAILPDPGENKQEGIRSSLHSRYRIEPLFYDDKNNHAELTSLLLTLADDVRIHTKKMLKAKMPILKNIEDEDDGISKIYSFVQELEVAGLQYNNVSADVTTLDTLTHTKLDLEIDDVFRYVKNGQPDIAVAMYKKILGREGDTIDPRLKYRLHANIGNACCSMNKKKKAAEEYLIATDYWEETKEAQAIKALGHLLKGENAKAYAIAERLCREHPDYSRPYVIRLQSQWPQQPFRDARREIPVRLRRNPEISYVLSGLADEQRLRRQQVIYASIAWKNSPDWIEAGLNYAAALLVYTRDQSVINIAGKLIPHNTTYAKEAESILNRILEILPATDPGGWRGLIYFNRASARRFLGLDEEASRDLEEAYRYSRNDPRIVGAFAQQQEGIVGINEGIRIIEQCESRKDDLDLSILLGIFLYQRSTNNDLERALETLLPWIQRVTESVVLSHRYELLQITCKILISLGKVDEAVGHVNDIPEAIIPALVKRLLLLEIKIDAKEIDNEDAKRVCAELAVAFDKGGEFIIWRNLALSAEKIECHSIAYAAWKRIIPPLYYNSDTHRMLHTASHAHKDDFILAFCGQLRKNNIHNRKAYIHEIEALIACHEFNQAMDKMNAWLEHDPNDREMRMNLSLLAAEFERKEYIETEPSNLPLIENVPNAEYGVRVVMALKYSTNPLSAITYAYNLWRRYPDNMATQHTLISLIYMYEPKVVSTPNLVDCNSAVFYKEIDSDISRTHIIEGGPSPSIARDEYSPDHIVSKELIGKTIGDSFFVNRRKYTVVAVHNKYAFVANRLLKDFSTAFPNNTLFREFRVSSGYEATRPQQALGEVKEFLQEQESHQKHLEDLYQHGAIPVLMFAQRMGKSVLETMLYFVNSKNHHIRVCSGFPVEHQAALAQLSNKCDVVLDETAIATLFMLGLHKELVALPYNMIVPETAIHEIRRVANNAVISKRSNGHLGMVNGQLIFHEFTPSEQARWIDSLEELLDCIRRHCKIQGGKAILGFELDTRKQLIECLGPASADAIAITKENDIAFWTDDFLTGTWAANTCQIKRVWTQAVLEYASKQNKQLNSKYLNAIKNMFAWGYDFTAVSIAPIVSLYKDAAWNSDDWRAQRVEEFLIRVGAINPDNCRLTSLLLVRIWHNCPRRSMAIKLITNLLDKIGRQNAGPRIARPIYRGQIPLPKTRNVSSLKRMLRSWRQNQLKK